ncbi:MAG: hypothetical protein OXG30_06310 [bacterium]|nr:hypothetical protein [bacterium]
MQQNQPSLDNIRIDVIQALQDQIVESSKDGPLERAPGSRESVKLEQAIDYATSSKRKRTSPTFLEFDVLRNAEFATNRWAKSHARLLRAIAAHCAPRHQAFNGHLQTGLHLVAAERLERPGTYTSGPGGQVAGTAIVVQTTPEDEAVARDLEECIRTKVATTLDQLASDVLDDMLLEKSVSETAERLGISNRTVNRTRQKIRNLAEPILRSESMAA